MVHIGTLISTYLDTLLLCSNEQIPMHSAVQVTSNILVKLYFGRLSQYSDFDTNFFEDCPSFQILGLSFFFRDNACPPRILLSLFSHTSDLFSQFHIEKRLRGPQCFSDSRGSLAVKLKNWWASFYHPDRGKRMVVRAQEPGGTGLSEADRVEQRHTT